MTVETAYEKSLRHALEHIYIVAARRGWDTGTLIAASDDGRASGVYQEHTLSVSIRDTQFTVTTTGIPREWIDIGTGFIDTRFSQRIEALLVELEKKSKGL